MDGTWDVEAVEFAGKPGTVAGYRAVRDAGRGRTEYLVRRGERVLIGEGQSQHDVEMNASLVPTEAVAMGMIARVQS